MSFHNQFLARLLFILQILTLAIPMADAQDIVGSTVMSPIQEIAWENWKLKKFMKNRGFSDDEHLALRVHRVGRRLARVSDHPDQAFRFRVLKGDELQAYSFPGGTVCVSEGLGGGLSRRR